MPVLSEPLTHAAMLHLAMCGGLQRVTKSRKGTTKSLQLKALSRRSNSPPQFRTLSPSHGKWVFATCGLMLYASFKMTMFISSLRYHRWLQFMPILCSLLLPLREIAQTRAFLVCALELVL